MMFKSCEIDKEKYLKHVRHVGPCTSLRPLSRTICNVLEELFRCLMFLCFISPGKEIRYPGCGKSQNS